MNLNSINQLEFKDCLSQIDDNSIDLICIDPPYEINYNNLEWDKSNTIDWKFLFLKSNRVLKPTGNLIMFMGWSNVFHVLEQKGEFDFLQLKNSIIWDRMKGRGAKRNLISTREDILWFVKSDNYTYHKLDSTIKKKTKGMGTKNGSDYRRLSNVWTDISSVAPMSKEYNGYPCQKPRKLIERILNVFSNEGDTILDFFCGSGTTGVVSQKMNRNFILSDNKKEAVELSRKRIEMSGV